MNKTITGIGTRSPSIKVEPYVKHVCDVAYEYGYDLNSGGADGMDKMFEDNFRGNKNIFIPWRGFNGSSSQLYNITSDALKLASSFHPAWYNLSNPVKQIMARNVYQVLGYDLSTPSKAVICYTQDGKDSGGTGQALRIARGYGIPIFNLKSICGYNYVTQQCTDFLKTGIIEVNIIRHENLYGSCYIASLNGELFVSRIFRDSVNRQAWKEISDSLRKYIEDKKFVTKINDYLNISN